MEGKIKTQIGWNFDNSYSQLPKAFYTLQNPTPVVAPKLVKFNESLANTLGINSEYINENEADEVFAGNKIPEGALPLAQAYGGHQFGHFTMLGDGRAVLLGEQLTPNGKRFDIQLKGSGRTPYSRGGDGRAALGPMLREYIISEAMFALGIPTTRSLAVVTTGEPIYRDTVQPGAIMTRVAASHIRVGTFQYAATWGTVEDLKALADYTLKRHFPKVETDENRYISLLKEVVKAQASLIAKWQLVGFIHGVMNTDNMAISGETIDYGPCAFMDSYDPKTVFSSIDREGRYAYGNQPYIGGWDLARFAETLLPLLHEDQDQAIKIAQAEIEKFSELYHNHWLTGMRSKLGIFNEELQNKVLIEELLSIMKNHSADYTNTFSALTLDKFYNNGIFETQEFSLWKNQWENRLKRQQQSKEEAKKLMMRSNPMVIPRNHRVEEALEAAVKSEDFSVMDRLLKVLSTPYEYSQEQEEYTKLPPQSSCGYRTFCGT